MRPGPREISRRKVGSDGFRIYLHEIGHAFLNDRRLRRLDAVSAVALPLRKATFARQTGGSLPGIELHHGFVNSDSHLTHLTTTLAAYAAREIMRG